MLLKKRTTVRYEMQAKTGEYVLRLFALQKS